MQLYQQLGEELSHQPGVKSVSFQFIVPLSHRALDRTLLCAGWKPSQVQHE